MGEPIDHLFYVILIVTGVVYALGYQPLYAQTTLLFEDFEDATVDWRQAQLKSETPQRETINAANR